MLRRCEEVLLLCKTRRNVVVTDVESSGGGQMMRRRGGEADCDGVKDDSDSEDGVDIRAVCLVRAIAVVVDGIDGGEVFVDAG